MRTVGIAALTALVVALLVVLVRPRPAPPTPTDGGEAHPEVLRRLDALEHARATGSATETVRLEGRAKPSALRLRAFEARLERLEEASTARPGADTGAAVAETGETDDAAAAAAKKAADDDYQTWIDRLYDDNENVAFSATIELSRIRDARAVKPLAYVLRTHRDYYVRLGAAAALGNLQALEAVPALLDALADKDQLVCTAAHDALRKITSGTVPYDASAPKEERLEAQAAWRQWFRENEERLGGIREDK